MFSSTQRYTSKNGSGTKFNVVLLCCISSIYHKKSSSFLSLDWKKWTNFTKQGVDHGFVMGSQCFGEARYQLELEESPSRNTTSFRVRVIRKCPKIYHELHCLYSTGFDLLSKNGLEVASLNYIKYGTV